MVRTAGLVLALGGTLVTGVDAAPRSTHPKRAETAAETKSSPATPPAAPAFVLPPAPPAPESGDSRFGVVGQKYASPQTRMSQAGVRWSLSKRLSFHLSYERTAYAPMMSRDHDNGILTGLQLGF